jgi:hypothetical protein
MSKKRACGGLPPQQPRQVAIKNAREMAMLPFGEPGH